MLIFSQIPTMGEYSMASLSWVLPAGTTELGQVCEGAQQQHESYNQEKLPSGSEA